MRTCLNRVSIACIVAAMGFSLHGGVITDVSIGVSRVRSRLAGDGSPHQTNVHFVGGNASSRTGSLPVHKVGTRGPRVLLGAILVERPAWPFTKGDSRTSRRIGQ